MNHIFRMAIVALIFLAACNKQPNSNKESEKDPPSVPTANPAGKWVSVAYYSGNTWQPIAMPHYFEFNSSDLTFGFRDHNGILCTGQFAVSSPNNTYTLISFPGGDCGLTDRIADRLGNDTLVLTVVSPPNVTQDKVKYLLQP